MITPTARPVDIAKGFPELRPLAKSATRLHPRRGRPQVHGSSIGGPLLCRADEAWPAGHLPRTVEHEPLLTDPRVPDVAVFADPMVSLLQLDASDAPGTAFPDRAELLQVLLYPHMHHDAPGSPYHVGPALLVVWRRASDVHDVLEQARAPASDAYEYYLPRPCVLSPEQVVEYPDLADLPSALGERVEAWSDALEDERGLSYWADLSTAPGWKIGGWPSWVEEPYRPTCQCGASRTLLLCIATSEWGGRSWRPPEDRHYLDQGIEGVDVAEPTDVIVGDHGDLQLFSCPRDHRHPLQMVTQLARRRKALAGTEAPARAELTASRNSGWTWRGPGGKASADLEGLTMCYRLQNREFPAIIDLMADDEASLDVSMLLAFRAENVRSFRDGLELSLLATALAEKGVPHSVPWRVDGRPIEVLPAAGIFGANASGKSNLLRAMSDMRRHVLYSFSHGDPERGMPRSAFRLDSARQDSPSRFEVDLVLHGIRHEYGFVIDDTRVLEEWAYRYPRGKAALLFRREGADVALGERNRAKGRAVMEILRPNSLLLSAAAAASHPDLAPLRRWFADNLLLAEASSRARRWAYTTGMLQQEHLHEQVLGLLQAADLGITDARVREVEPEFLERLKRATRIVQGREDEQEDKDSEVNVLEPGVVLSHRGPEGTVEFDADEESLGTMVWFGLAGPVIHALANGSVLLVDEIEASLHPALVTQLVRLFQDSETNPKGAQLVFNSHEASLLGDSGGERVLGRDQVWFTEKRHDGASRLYALSDLSPRADEAIGRRYLAGRYGATPLLSAEEFAEVALSAAGDPR